MQPADRGALARVTEGLQFGAPRLAEPLGDLILQLCFAPARSAERGAQPVLGDEDVAVHAGDGVEDAELRRGAVALALSGGARLGRHLEAQQVPATQRGRQLRRRARITVPGELSTPSAR